VNRKDVIINLVTLPVAAGAVMGSLAQADAAATMDQKAAQYQDTPKNHQQCSGCSLYIPAKTNPSKNRGACKLVKGSIAPAGWCKYWTKKT